MRTFSRGLGAVTILISTTLLPAGAAWAHTEVGDGDLALVIGFGAEPAYAGQPNSVEVLVTHGGEPVTDLRPGDLQVEISYGDASTTMDLEPDVVVGSSGEPGGYRAWFVPTEPGSYTFRITGAVGGEEVDEEVTSGPATFSDVIDLAEASFPVTDAPSNEELATRIEQDAARMQDAIARAEDAASDAAAAAAGDEAAEDAAAARTTAMIALLVGAIGVIAGIAGIATARAARAAG